LTTYQSKSKPKGEPKPVPKSVQYVNDIFLSNNRMPRDPRQVDILAGWYEKNLLPEKFNRFTKLVISKGIIPIIAELNEMLHEAPECTIKYSSRIQSYGKIPSQEDEIKTWCPKCMNSGIILHLEFHDHRAYEFTYRCSCKAGNKYPWMTLYEEKQGKAIQFPWEHSKYQFYHEAYQKEKYKLIMLNWELEK